MDDTIAFHGHPQDPDSYYSSDDDDDDSDADTDAEPARGASDLGYPDADENDADDDDSSDEGDGSSSGLDHVCVVCGAVSDIETPHIRTESYCRECAAFRTFVREDHHDSDDE